MMYSHAGIPLTARPNGASPSPATSASCMLRRSSSQPSCHPSAAPFWVFAETVFVFGAGVRRVVCPVGYLEPSIRSNMEEASVFVLHLHSSGVQTGCLVQERHGPVSEGGSLVPTKSRDIANFSIPLPLIFLSLSGRAESSHRVCTLYLQCSSPMLRTSCGVAGCLRSSGLTAGSPAAYSVV